LKVSLRTAEFVITKLRCRKFSSRFEQLIKTVSVMSTLGKDKIKQLIRAFFLGFGTLILAGYAIGAVATERFQVSIQLGTPS